MSPDAGEYTLWYSNKTFPINITPDDISHPNNQLCTENSGGYCASFVAVLHLLHCITDDNSVRNFSALNPEKKDNKTSGKPHHAIANRRWWPCVVSKKNWNTKKEKGSTMIPAV